MSKKWILGVGAILCTQIAFAGIAFADTTTGDTVVSISTGTSTTLPSTGTLLYETQESVYQTTGLDVEHDYVWVYVDGTPVLAVDPPHANFSK